MNNHIADYYDGFAERKLKDFVQGNIRVERAWKTIVEWMPENPQRILEIGCGIGDTSFKMARKWPQAEVLGVDISEKMIGIAQQLFQLPNLHYQRSELGEFAVSGKFDMIVLVDVYEHIARNERKTLHHIFSTSLSQYGRLVLTVPTKKLLDYIKKNAPQRIQPIDEDITLDVVLQIVQDMQSSLLKYEEVNVVFPGDYAHIVIGEYPEWIKKDQSTYKRVDLKQRVFMSLHSRLEQLDKIVNNAHYPEEMKKQKRQELIQRQLGAQFVPK